jgi:hypothetical protein
MRKITIVLLFWCLIFEGHTQDSNLAKLPFLRMNYQAGSVMPTNNFVQGENQKGEAIKNYQSGAIELGLQTNGIKQWHHDWNFPKVGVGFYTADFFNDEELGQPMALYGFFNNELKKWNKFSISFEGAAGITYNWNPWDPITNPSQMAIGSYNTVYLDFGLRAQYMLAKRWELDLAYTFTHFSNGASTLPNLGLNMTGPKLAVAYHFNGNENHIVKRENSSFEKKNEFVIDFKYGSKQVKFDTTITQIKTEYLGINYNVYGLQLGYLRHGTPKWKYGGGLDVAYDESTTAQLDVVDSIFQPVKTPDKYHWNLSAYVTGQMIVGKTTFFVDMGYYLLREDIPGQTPNFYQRFGTRWNVYKGIQIGGALRAYNMGIADYIEWSIGYKL